MDGALALEALVSCASSRAVACARGCQPYLRATGEVAYALNRPLIAGLSAPCAQCNRSLRFRRYGHHVLGGAWAINLAHGSMQRWSQVSTRHDVLIELEQMREREGESYLAAEDARPARRVARHSRY